MTYVPHDHASNSILRCCSRQECDAILLHSIAKLFCMIPSCTKCSSNSSSSSSSSSSWNNSRSAKLLQLQMISLIIWWSEICDTLIIFVWVLVLMSSWLFSRNWSIYYLLHCCSSVSTIESFVPENIDHIYIPEWSRRSADVRI